MKTNHIPITTNFACYFIKYEEELKKMAHSISDEKIITIIDPHEHKELCQYLDPKCTENHIIRTTLTLEQIKTYAKSVFSNPLDVCDLEYFLLEIPINGCARGLYLGNGFITFDINPNTPPLYTTLTQNIERIKHFLEIIKHKYCRNSIYDYCIFTINVDTVVGRFLAEMISPDVEKSRINWVKIKQEGKIPIANGIAIRSEFSALLSDLNPKLGNKLKLCEGVPSLICDYETIDIFNTPGT